MNDQALERRLAHWLIDGPHDAPAEVVARALADARTMPQAKVVELPWTHLPRLTIPRPQALAAAMSVAVVVLALAFGLWSFQNQLVPPATSPSPAAAPTSTPTAAPSPPATPTASPDPTPSLVPTPSPEPTPTGTAGTLPQPTPHVVSVIEGDVYGLLTLDTGYVAYGAVRDGDGVYWSTAWFSADGTEWEATGLAVPAVFCPGSQPAPDSTVLAGATNGRQALLVGSHRSAEPDCSMHHSIAWLSPDGTTWIRASPFGEKNDTWVNQVWWVDGGWEALTTGGIDEPTILWRSDNGVAWRQAATIFPGVTGDRPVAGRGAVAPDGRRLLAIEEPGFLVALLTSQDGIGWQPLETFSGAENSHGVLAVVAPSLDGPDRWLVIQDAADGLHAWSSADLQDWAHARLPVEFVTTAASTTYGLLIASDATLLASDDGVEWRPVADFGDAETRVAALVENPGGLLAVTFRADGRDLARVYRVPLLPSAED